MKHPTKRPGTGRILAALLALPSVADGGTLGPSATSAGPTNSPPTGTSALTYTVTCEPGSGPFIPCPCGNPPSGPARGCDNFGSMTGGASLTAPGNSSLANDTVVLTAAGENSTAFTVFFQGRDPVHSTGVAVAAGVRCVTNTLKRLYTGNASGGAIARPAMGGGTVSARSAALGDPILPGQSRHYFTIYRDALAAGPCGDTSSTVNLSNVASVVWN